MPKIYYPDNLTDILSGYQEKEHNRIRNRYEAIYSNNINSIRESKKDEFKIDQYNHNTHCRVLSSILIPFLKYKIENYDLFFIEPLSFLKANNELPEHTMIWDFVLGEIKEDKLTRIILGEVKGQKARGFSKSIEKQISDYAKNGTLDKIYDYIIKIISEGKEIEVLKEDIKVVYVLVIQNLYYKNYEASIKGKTIPLNIWEIKTDILQGIYMIEIHREDILNGNEIEFSEEEMPYRHMLNTLQDKKFNIEDFIQFTFVSDIDMYLDLIYKSYRGLYGLEYSDDNLSKLINQAGGGKFYDDNRILPEMVKRIKERLEFYGVIKIDGTQFKLKQKIDIKEKIIEHRVKKGIKERDGHEILDQTIQELNPERVPRMDLGDWI